MPLEPGRSVFLIGPMGSGKTTVGRQLARRLGYRFLDSDADIEARGIALAARNALIDLDQQRAAAWVSLYRALGGGWSAGA